MMKISNFHTHTVYCDGVNTAEEIVLSAIDKNMSAIGFSGHAYTPFDDSFCMSKESAKEYKEEITRLKEKYSGKINVYLGLEMDYFSEDDGKDLDFIIGSVHYVFKNGEYYSVDESEKVFKENIKKGWDGDFYAFCEDYYALVSDVKRKTGADIIGHFDLVTKFNEGEKLFSEKSPRYVKAWKSALDSLLKENCVFEINTGAMARGYRSSPYPSIDILKKIKDVGGKAIFSSDAHDSKNLDFGCDLAEAYAKEAGFLCLYDFNIKKNR